MRLPIYLIFLLIVSACKHESPPKETAASSRRPNVLLFLADDWSFPHAGVYGDRTVKTPNFDALAAGGMLFTNAFTASPSCSPSRASILTGRYPHQNGVAGNLWSEFPADLTVYPEVLEAAGYATGFEQKGWAPGDWAATGRTQNPTGHYQQDITAFLDGKDPEKPFCYWFGTSDPHRDYESSLGVLTGMKPDSVVVPAFFPDLPCVRNDIMDYYAEVERLDRHLGQVVNLLRERGELDNTLIIVSSDNGMPFPRAKATLYDAGTRMPFVAHWPARIPAGGVHDGYVNLASIASTFVDAAGLNVPAEMILPSLLPTLLDPEVSAGDEVFLERERHAQVRAGFGSYAMRGIRTDSFLYIRNFYPDRWPAGDPEAVLSVGAYGDVDNSITKMLMLAGAKPAADTTDYYRLAFGKRPSEELYHLSNDPYQLNNLASEPAFSAPLSDHRTRVLAKMRETNDPRVADPQTSLWDEARYTPTYGKSTFDRDAFIEAYVYKAVGNGVRFKDQPCLPVKSTE